MLFSTPIFLFLFLPLFLIAYFGFSRKIDGRNLIALAASVLFFAWGEPVFVFALIASVFVDYRIALLITPEPEATLEKLARKRRILLLGIAFSIIALVASKYLNFLVTEMINPLAPWTKRTYAPPNLPLILGISFITFHRISYLVDSYRGRAVPPRNFFECALYIFLFPQLIAGPIIRYIDIGSQIRSREHSTEGFLTGANRFAVGLFKKLIVADPLGLLADRIFAAPIADLPLSHAWGGLLAYTLQIYFDFSAYSDMALGLARMMGFRFPENFNRPYISTSITEFWRRWHISLSKWMQLYLYIPLGGNRISPGRTYLNLWIVFFFSGIWHGASWNFIVWGAYYGFFLAAERMASGSGILRIPGGIKWLATTLIVMIGWVLFRAPNLQHATDFLGIMFGMGAAPEMAKPWGVMFGTRELVTMFFASLLAFARVPDRVYSLVPAGLSAAWSDSMTIPGLRQAVIQFVTTSSLLVISAAAMLSADYSPFLYFRF